MRVGILVRDYPLIGVFQRIECDGIRLVQDVVCKLPYIVELRQRIVLVGRLLYQVLVERYLPVGSEVESQRFEFVPETV